jgi:peptidase E
MDDRRMIVALGGGGFQMTPDDRRLDDHILDVVRQRSGRARPRVCLIPTATGDDREVIASFETLFADRAETSVLRLFARSNDDLRALVLRQDAVYVLGGNTANLLALWRLHGLDTIFRDAWGAGIVLAGMSAGAICWFEACTTDSFGPELRPLTGALGFLTGTFVPHYHGEPQRRPLTLRLVADGSLPAGYAVDDDVALVFRGTEIVEAVAVTEAGAWRVEPDGRGGATETALAVRRVGGDASS